MLRIIHSIPDECVGCGAPKEKLGGRILSDDDYAGNLVFCHACGIFMAIQDQDEEEEYADLELAASFVSCPHCKTLNDMQVAGGDEWCSACGLDPSILDYSTEQLASLWKEDSGIRNFMERGIPRPATRMYRFLTTLCGPHCTFAEDCPQSTGNFSTCLKEEAEGDPMLLKGETNVGSKKKRKKERKLERERIDKEKKKAVVEFSPSGWYAKVMKHHDETEDPPKSTHTGSGPGT